ncbi:hypothetical protein NL108_015391 [Boleophthalmus pectinirostris]|uniref:A-kinase-interacting protein 1 n=1 Tax=Boleophthalmus pectinirostris TaxID=150288 RepID=UPI000A1C2A79|nr:A-kinase-interacting protein 1 [Boleophthalmus pectinirostris]KAJ0069866.1 hypothetical protein NL108_015391 [Boleophthalmus pectinirostris]
MSDLDVSLQRSLVLGLEVLDRASKRKVDWTQISPASCSSDSTQRESREETYQEMQQENPEQGAQRVGVKLTKAFSSLSEFMSQTSLLCQKYHVSLASLSHSEQTHVCRFHGSSSASLSPTTHLQSGEDFYIEVRPGTYSVTASALESPRQHSHLVSGSESLQQQTHLVSLDDGDSVLLTFHL